MRAIVLSALTSLLIGVSLSPAFGQAPQERLSQAVTAPDAQGTIGLSARTQSGAGVLSGSPSKVCLQLHLGAAVFNFNLNFDADIYPYPITGGAITGSICSGAWHVTGGFMGTTLEINGQINTLNSNCMSFIKVVGASAVNLPSYVGSYGFSQTSTNVPSNMFTHHTLFLGIERPTCP